MSTGDMMVLSKKEEGSAQTGCVFIAAGFYDSATVIV